ncbi:SGNH/GDSL hydrolase family protein [Candidatus Gottesmanbacteria bacterium]|nr:SGNH/GDSL hydrolase family protein [Candidatus Gottesmanbacteria bacterium]
MKRILLPILKGLFVFSLFLFSATQILAACEGLTDGALEKDGKGILILGDSLSCSTCYSGGLGEIRSAVGKHAYTIASEVQQMSDEEISRYSAVVVFAGINDLAGSTPQSYEQVRSSLGTIYAKFSGKIPIIGITLYYYNPSSDLQSRLTNVNKYIESNTNYHINLSTLVAGMFSPGADPIHFGQKGHNDLKQAVRNEFAKICGDTNTIPTPSATPVPSGRIIYAFPQTTGVALLPFLANFAKGCQTEKGITCVATEYIINMFGSVMPSNNTLVTPKISDMANALDRSNTYLLPAKLYADIKIPDPYKVSISGNAGTENHSDNGQKCFQPKKGIITSDFPVLNNLLAQTLTNNSFLALGKRDTLDYYNEFIPEILRETSTRGCIDEDKGYSVKEIQEKSIGEHEYAPDSNPFVKAAIKLGGRYEFLLSLISKLGFAKEDASAGVDVKAYWHILCPYCDEIAEKFTTNKNGERKDSGIVTAQLPATIDLIAAPGKTNQDITSSIGEKPDGTMKAPYAGLGGMRIAYDRLGCAYAPAGLQQTDCTNTPLENFIGSKITSTWAINGQSSISTTISSADYKKSLEDAARKVGIPECVLEGISYIEGGELIPQLEKNACLESVNVCSAAGAMQFTTGSGPANDRSCNACGVGFCPNAWSQYGSGGNPCNWNDALFAAARMLKDQGPLSNVDPKSQKSQIMNAGYRYYGSNNDELARRRLGGCEYGEFVYKTCDKSYKCAKEQTHF